MKYVYNKLVRDNVPDNINSKEGKKCSYKILNDALKNAFKPNIKNIQISRQYFGFIEIVITYLAAPSNQV